jgi:Ion channel
MVPASRPVLSTTRRRPDGPPTVSSGTIAGTLALLHVWRLILLCAAITHERAHPALALLMLVPLNHLLHNLTASVGPSDHRSTHWTRIAAGGREALPPPDLGRAGRVVAIHLLASILVVWWYGSLGALRAEVGAFSGTWEFWALVITLVALDLVYRPLIRALSRLVGATGLLDSRLWSALFLAIAVWVWCAGVFAALYQQISLYCDGSHAEWCEGGQVFSQSLARFVDAAYFSTITLSTTGYGDILPLSDVARALVSVEIIIGFGLLGFLLSRVAGYVSPTSAERQSVEDEENDPG